MPRAFHTHKIRRRAPLRSSSLPIFCESLHLGPEDVYRRGPRNGRFRELFPCSFLVFCSPFLVLFAFLHFFFFLCYIFPLVLFPVVFFPPCYPLLFVIFSLCFVFLFFSRSFSPYFFFPLFLSSLFFLVVPFSFCALFAVFFFFLYSVLRFSFIYLIHSEERCTLEFH